jgi:hypothetical protein
MCSLHFLVHIASGNEKGYLSLHTVPPELLLQILVHLGSSRVDLVGGVVGFLHDELFEVFNIRHTQPSIVPQNSFGINRETRNFLPIHPTLDTLNTFMSHLSFHDLIQ